MNIRKATVFGGGGFLGRHLVKRLAERGTRVRVAVRDPEAAAFLKPMGDVGQIVPVQANLRHPPSVARAIEGADVVVNFVGILHESGRQTFGAVHVGGARRIAETAAAAGIERLVHISAIGADPQGTAKYARSKAAGEAAVRGAFPEATILRPSLVFGPEDHLFNRFAAMARLSPALPLIGGGHTRFQPVYVGDVADAVMHALDDEGSRGVTYELGGPTVYTFKELMQLLLRQIGRRRLLLPLPYGLAKFQAAFLQLLPSPPLTIDQVEMLKLDNVVSEGMPGLAELGVIPTPAENILPSYLARFRPFGALEPSRRS